jgi:pyruvate dehydrogenase E2 component (dihydrolipoamide acetyltransferase)
MPAASFGEIPAGPDVEIIEISKMRRRIAQRMIESQQQVPHFYVTASIDVTDLLNLRKQLNESLPEEGKISVNDLIVKAVALTLRQFPNLNSHYYGDRLARHKNINIGIAVALPGGGLMNVIARNADQTALGTMAAQNRDMINRARDGKVKPEDVEGGTFSVSNLGPYDVDFFSAIINPPEAGILAIGAAKKTPTVLPDDTIGVRVIMKATISVDHRVSDGAEGADFMKTFKDLLEHPMRLLV